MASYWDDPVDMRGQAFGSGQVYYGDGDGDDQGDDAGDADHGDVTNVFVFNGPVVVDDGYDDDGDIVNDW